MSKKVNKMWYTISNTRTIDKDVAYMPNTEVSMLDLRTQEVKVAPFPYGSDSTVVEGLNYVWIYVQDVGSDTEVPLRFKLADHRLVLRSEHDAVQKVEAQMRAMLSSDVETISWQAIMVHYPTPSVARIESHVVVVGDNLEVEALKVHDESQVTPKVILGPVTKIELASV